MTPIPPVGVARLDHQGALRRARWARSTVWLYTFLILLNALRVFGVIS